MMRLSAATNCVRAGVDLDVVQALLGHASLASTTAYQRTEGPCPTSKTGNSPEPAAAS
jgi:site-specific recombinase XerD